jgi:glycosyltransferase involved in cell wall biosynthesis
MKILFIAMSDSIHTARWINQISEKGWDIHLFPSIDYGASHPDLKNVTIYHSIYGVKKNQNPNVKYSGYPVFSNIIAWGARLIKKIIYPNYRAEQLKKVIFEFKPDIIHSMEFQGAGYLTLQVKKMDSDPFPTWIATNWGSDIYYFRRFSEHKEKIQEILEQCDYYSCECERDILLARKLGFKGKTLPVLPNAGGFDLERLKNFRQPGNTSKRRIILLKGYQGWAGRAMVGLRAIELCAQDLKDYQVVIFSCNSRAVRKYAALITKKTGLPITIFPPSQHDDILRLFGRARIYIGLSISDAISTSLLESITLGAFPIQSNTSCADEWIVDGKSGFIVPPEDPETVASAIRKAISGNELVDNAALINEETARKFLDYWVIKDKVIKFYTKLGTDRSEWFIKGEFSS